MDALAADRLAIHGLARQRATDGKRHSRARQQQSMPECAPLKSAFATGSLSIMIYTRVLIHDLHSLSKAVIPVFIS